MDNFSLKDPNNYHQSLTCDIPFIMDRYADIVIQYFSLVLKSNIISNTTDHTLEFIVNRGLNTITHVFLHLLYVTQNMDLVYFHTTTSLNLYLDFMSNLYSVDNNNSLFSSRDAVRYVYEKTIFKLRTDLSNYQLPHRACILLHINIYKLILYHLTQNNITQKHTSDIDHHLTLFAEFVKVVTSHNLNDATDTSKLQSLYDYIIINIQTMGDFEETIAHFINYSFI